jgi:hypothetical protein
MEIILKTLDAFSFVRSIINATKSNKLIWHKKGAHYQAAFEDYTLDYDELDNSLKLAYLNNNKPVAIYAVDKETSKGAIDDGKSFINVLTDLQDAITKTDYKYASCAESELTLVIK